MQKLNTTTLDLQRIRDFSIELHEPDWMLDKRLNAFKKYEKIAMPTHQRIDYSFLDLKNYKFFEHQTNERPLELVNNTGKISSSSLLTKKINSLVVKDSVLVSNNLSEDLLKKSVIFMTLETALIKYPNLVKKYFNTDSVQQVNDGKFSLLNAASWRGGVFLYVPKNIEINLPIQSISISEEDRYAHIPHTLIVVEENSRVTFVDSFISASEGIDAFISNVVEIFVSPSSKINYISLQENSKSVSYFATKRCILKRNASINWFEILVGSKLAKNKIEAILEEPGAEATMSGLYHVGAGQQMEFNTVQMHIAPHTKSDLLYIGALKENARTSYQGIIRVNKGAQKTDAYQKNNNLLLSQNAQADSEPLLEIEANDVRCTHGATISPIDEEDLFYLMSRGLYKGVATNLLVQGFFSNIIEKIPIIEIKESLKLYIEEHGHIKL